MWKMWSDLSARKKFSTYNVEIKELWHVTYTFKKYDSPWEKCEVAISVNGDSKIVLFLRVNG